DDGQVKLPIRLRFLDPLQRIRTVGLEVWAGSASPARPFSLVQPKALPGDGARKNLAATYKDGGAQVDIPVPSLTGDQVLWIQPFLTDAAGARHWARAIAYKPSELLPLERKAAVLQQQLDRQPQRTIKLLSAAKVRAFKGASELLI